MVVANVLVVLSVLTTVAAVDHQCCSRLVRPCSIKDFTFLSQGCFNLYYHLPNSNDSVRTLQFCCVDSNTQVQTYVNEMLRLCHCCSNQLPTEQPCYVSASLQQLQHCLSNCRNRSKLYSRLQLASCYIANQKQVTSK